MPDTTVRELEQAMSKTEINKATDAYIVIENIGSEIVGKNKKKLKIFRFFRIFYIFVSLKTDIIKIE